VTLPVLFAEPGLFRFPLFRFEQQRHRGIGRDRLLASCQKSIGEKRVAAPTIIIIPATTIITGAITVVTDDLVGASALSEGTEHAKASANRLRRKSDFLSNLRLIWAVSPANKIFRFTFLKIGIITNAVSRPHEGRIAIVTTRWARDAMDAAFPKANGSAAYGQVVWFWRRVCWRKALGKYASWGRR
jgi:hypothetical protein